jgi:DNA-binding MarR family transcriptional regulator
MYRNNEILTEATKRDAKDRILSKIQRGPNGHWLWRGTVRQTPYRQCMVYVPAFRRALTVPRLAAWIWKDFDMDPLKVVIRKCNNLLCVAPDHLEITDSRGLAEYMKRTERYVASARKMSAKDVSEMRSIYKQGGISVVEIAEMYSIHPDAALRAISGQSFKDWPGVSEPPANIIPRQGHRTIRGNQIANAKLTPQQVLDIVALADDETQTEIAERFGVAQTQVSSIFLGKTWRHITGIDPKHPVGHRRGRSTAKTRARDRRGNGQFLPTARTA